MEIEKVEGKQAIENTPTPSGERAKKAYRAPELVEWGSIENLTKGDVGKDADGLAFQSP